jgi:hypothetical protein
MFVLRVSGMNGIGVPKWAGASGPRVPLAVRLALLSLVSAIVLPLIGGVRRASASAYGPNASNFVYFNEVPGSSTNTGYHYRNVAGTTWVGTFTTGMPTYIGGNLTFVGTFTETIIGVGAKPECLGDIVLKRHITNLASVMSLNFTVTGDGGIPCSRPIGSVTSYSVTESVPQPTGSNFTLISMRKIVQPYVPGGPSVPKLVWPKWTVVATGGAACRDITTNSVVGTIPVGTSFAVSQALIKTGTTRLRTIVGGTPCNVRASTTQVKPYLLPF